MAFAVAFLVGGRLGDAFLAAPYDLLAGLASTLALVLALNPLRRAADRVTTLASGAAAPAALPAPAAADSPILTRPPQAGDLLLGRYRVKQLLGEGDQGATWLCHDDVLHRAVVVKAIPMRPGLSAHLEEARHAAGARSPHVVETFDVAQDGAYGLILMEFMPGGNFAARLGRGPLGGPALTRLTVDVLSGLAAAHRCGIVHGDVKPANVLLDSEGRAKVGGFGTARRPDSFVTRGATTAGTVALMAPEQVRGELPTPASDVHAAGAILALAATGRHPYYRAGMDDFALRETILRVEPDIAGAPPAMEALLRRALAKGPTERYADADAMLRALESVLAARVEPPAE